MQACFISSNLVTGIDKMKIGITGSSGFVGRQIVPILERSGVEVLLFGRDTLRLQKFFPDRQCANYSEFAKLCAGCDIIVHLAAINNNSSASYDEYKSINFDLTRELICASNHSGVKMFINVSSFHVLENKIETKYALTKLMAAKYVRENFDLNIINLYIPAVYGRLWGSKLEILNYLPKNIANFIFEFLKSLKPTVSSEKIVSYILKCSQSKKRKDVYLSDDLNDNLFYRIFKKIVDFSFAISISILFFWLLIFIWIAVLIESGRPGIFAQQRVGLHGKSFTCYKFRTMKQSTAEAATHEVSASAVTLLGRLLRSTKLDELPQIWNICRNELSLVGPRPCLPVQQELVWERAERGVLSVLPGITGLAQIQGVDMSDPNELANLDERYVATRSILLDIKIILATFLGRGRGDRVGA
jgi:lipopolysaccharide/colanic/teichoic acid biosynthesis glycosyltransferase